MLDPRMLALPSFLLLLSVRTSFTSSDLQSGLGMSAEKRSGESEAERHMVTVDLSALRPSLPGLVLYRYGDLAPKLVQVDLSALNPKMQPHVIWPQFDQLDMELDDRPFELDGADDDSIPYLSEATPLLSPRPQRYSRPTIPRRVPGSRPATAPANGLGSGAGWPEGMDDIADGDIYDFIPDSLRNEELMTLHQSLPLADEVIVPLDWEEEKTKRNVFVSKGWKPGGQKEREREASSGDQSSGFAKGGISSGNAMYTPFGLVNWRPGKKKQFHPRRETEQEDDTSREFHPGDHFRRNLFKKDVFVSKGWGPGGRSLRGSGTSQRANKNRGRHGRHVASQAARISSQESWAVPRRYWQVPHLFGVHFQ